ncbi:MAG: TlpA disulfide reductase family protein [Bacteroidota bacterium]
MKKTGILIAVLIGLYACKNSNQFKVVATVSGVETDRKVFVRSLNDNNQLVTIDTLDIKGGTFVYEGTAALPNIHYFAIQNIRGRIPVVIEPGTIRITAHKDSLNVAVVTGTPSNVEFGKITENFKTIVKKMGELRKEMISANRAKDSVAIAKIKDGYRTIQEETLAFQKKFIEENPQSYVSAMLLKQLLFSNAQGISIEEIQRLYDKLLKSVKATKEAVEVDTQLRKIATTAIGAVAPGFSGSDPEGNTLTLEDLKGKATVIHFWESRCKPCRVQNLNLEALYSKYHDQGLAIIGVSFDRKAEQWKKAIAEDKLNWNHISNLKHFAFDSIAQTYTIKKLPAIFILDAEGKIVAKNLDGEALSAQIESLLTP